MCVCVCVCVCVRAHIHKRDEKSCLFRFKGAGVRQIRLNTAKMLRGGVEQNITIF